MRFHMFPLMYSSDLLQRLRQNHIVVQAVDDGPQSVHVKLSERCEFASREQDRIVNIAETREEPFIVWVFLEEPEIGDV